MFYFFLSLLFCLPAFASGAGPFCDKETLQAARFLSQTEPSAVTEAALLAPHSEDAARAHAHHREALRSLPYEKLLIAAAIAIDPSEREVGKAGQTGEGLATDIRRGGYALGSMISWGGVGITGVPEEADNPTLQEHVRRDLLELIRTHHRALHAAAERLRGKRRVRVKKFTDKLSRRSRRLSGEGVELVPATAAPIAEEAALLASARATHPPAPALQVALAGCTREGDSRAFGDVAAVLAREYEPAGVHEHEGRKRPRSPSVTAVAPPAQRPAHADLDGDAPLLMTIADAAAEGGATLSEAPSEAAATTVYDRQAPARIRATEPEAAAEARSLSVTSGFPSPLVRDVLGAGASDRARRAYLREQRAALAARGRW